MTEKNHNLRKSENRLMFGLLSPSVLFVFLVSIIPLAYTFYLSFQNYSLLKPANATFAGIKNYNAYRLNTASHNILKKSGLLDR